MARIAPSILSADFVNLERDLHSISAADLIHVDVMDGHFVPNLTLGVPVVKRIQEVSEVPLDVHLMIENPDHWAAIYARTGAHSVTFHFEAAKDVSKTMSAIRESGALVGLAIKPDTAVSDVLEFLPEIDMLLVMTVEPGFGGQALIEGTISKVTEAREAVSQMGLATAIQVDGGITSANIAQLARAGADTFVAGTAVFSAANRNEEIRRLRELAITV
jgi:ribulose-phosphate 3-epimerase